jgi:hypothetical protein
MILIFTPGDVSGEFSGAKVYVYTPRPDITLQEIALLMQISIQHETLLTSDDVKNLGTAIRHFNYKP